jgi:hypothetical protein
MPSPDPTPVGGPNSDAPPAPIAPLVNLLGNAGLIPFVGLAVLMWLVNAEALPYVSLLLVSYAALIASFLGGMHWGLVWYRQSGHAGVPPLSDQAARQHLLWGIAPSLLAWPGMLMPEPAALPWLGAVLLVCYAVDRKLFTAAGLGHWLTLRFRLSTVAALSCFIAAGAV